ncbi:MAG: ribosome maturation factor RimP [Deltaproteobacteria bacterium]|nr:ribosome maturation factor RimP [Deltaproteobacteria bacterium]
MAQDTAQKIIELTSGIVAEEGCELLDVELVVENGQQILRLYIDKPAGSVTMADLSCVSRSVEDLLEVEGVIKSRYHLEVSSPGENRPLRLKEHFKKVIGLKVKVITKDKIDGRKNFKGVLTDVESDFLTLEIDNQKYRLPFTEVARARLVGQCGTVDR